MSAIEVRDLACAYDGRTVLREVSLEAKAGRILALIGPNGAGKTTLLMAMGRLRVPKAGVVRIGGEDLSRIPARRAARRLGFTPQTGGTPWPLTVEDAVSLGRAPHRGWLLPLRAEDKSAVARALDRTGLGHLRARRVTDLSGGESRRVAIARALAQQPEVLLLDEPTAHLDLRYQTQILEILREVAREGRIAVVITLHDLTLAALYADRIALLAEGRLVALGEPAQVLTEARLAEVYGVRVTVLRHPAGEGLLVLPAGRQGVGEGGFAPAGTRDGE